MKVRKSIAINNDIWELAREIAEKDNRSISNLLEFLILKEQCKNSK